jgi:hypothetical protein
LFGFANITAHNGWAMAAVGAAIVFSGLVVLSFVISQIHKILELWEQRDKFFARIKKGPSQTAESQGLETAATKEHHIPTVKELASIYRPLVTQLKEPFQIVQLFEITKKMDLPHPHLSIKSLQEAGILVAQGDGMFTWDNQKAS